MVDLLSQQWSQNRDSCQRAKDFKLPVATLLMKIVVTGCAGFIGYHVARHLLERGHRVIGIDNLSRGKPERLEELESLGARCEKKDILSVDCLEGDAVVHAAALISVEESWMKPLLYHEVNATGTLKLLLASAGRVRRFIYISSAAVYGDPVRLPIDEEHPTRPISPYGASKLAGECYARAFSTRIEVVILRLFNSYGIGQNPEYSGVISRFLERALSGKPLVVHGDGLQTRDFVHVRDVARAVEWALTAEPGTYNIASGRPTRIIDLAKMIAGWFGVGIVHGPPREGDIRQSYASTKADWRPSISLEEGLRELVELIRKDNSGRKPLHSES